MANKKEIRENGFEGFTSFKKLLENRESWELRDDADVHVSKMNNEELRRAIIENILVVTMWEKTFKERAVYTLAELFHHVHPVNYVRVQGQFYSSHVQDLLEKGSKELRIKQSMLEAAMTYCGVFYHGYGPLKGA